MNGLSKSDQIGNYRARSYRGRWTRPYRNEEEFQESDVWDVAMSPAASRDEEEPVEEYSIEDGDRDMTTTTTTISYGVSAPGVLLSRRLPSATSTMIPASNKRPQPGLDIDDQFSNYNSVTQQHSAPVTIPDWSKIYGPGGERTTTKMGDFYGAESDDDDEDEDEDDIEDESYDTGRERGYYNKRRGREVVPPHEWVARRNKIMMPSFSVCEGAGRTLKGRDLRRVRAAVLARTGFL